MKTALLIASLCFGFAAAAQPQNVEITVSAEVEVAMVNAACVQYLDATGAGKGYKMFYAKESLPQVTDFKAKGKDAAFVVGTEYCSLKNKGTLTFIDVPDATKSLDIDTKVLASGGYKTLKVVFYGYDQFGKDLNAAKAAAFGAL
jgi:hypothetical protein